MNLKSRHEVLSILYEKWDVTPDTETVSLNEAPGRVLAEDVFSEWTIPVVRASAMDGVAVKSSAFKDGRPDTTKWVRGVDYDRADTGDDFDDAFDAVIAIEQVELLPDGGILIDESVEVTEGDCVRPAGSTLMAGELMLEKGIRMRPAHIACAAMAGRDQLLVYKKPVVAFIPTGSELVPPGTPVARGQNINSNGPMAEAMICEMGGEPILYPIVKDKKAELEDILKDALSRADIVVISGGSSKGEEDFNTHILKEKGDLVTDGVAAVPGRPMTIALMDGKPVVNLSGPPFAAYYGLDWCIRAMICDMLGLHFTLRHTVRARLTEDVYAPDVMEMFMKLNVYRTRYGLTAEPIPRGSSTTADSFNANGILISTPGSGFIPAGTEIDVEMECTPDGIPFRDM